MLRLQSSCKATSEKRDLNAPRENSDVFKAALAIDLSSSSISTLSDFPCINDARNATVSTDEKFQQATVGRVLKYANNGHSNTIVTHHHWLTNFTVHLGRG